MKLRIYTDTSVIGGCLDDEFREESRRFLDMCKQGLAVLVLSDLTIQELEQAPEPVKAVLDEIPDEHSELVEFSQEANDLATKYLQHGVATEKSLVDAQHIAIATIERVDLLVSWNFKHIVNIRRIHDYNSVNLREGYPVLEIRSPLEVV